MVSTSSDVEPLPAGRDRDADQGLSSGDVTVRHASLKASLTVSGPIPVPEQLERYEQVLPGAAERILAMAERQSEHRQSIEKTVITAEARRQGAGLWCGLTVALAGLALAAYIASCGNTTGAAVMGTVDLVALVSVFVIGSQARKAERTEKARIQSQSSG